MTKLDGNGRWKTNFILPEHNAAILDFKRAQQRRKKPDPDEQLWAEWEQLLQESIETGREVTVTLYDPDKDVSVIGVVEKVDTQLRRVKVVGDKITWVPLADIIGVSPTT